MPSHLFVVEADIRVVECDAWVMSANICSANNEQDQIDSFFVHLQHKQWLDDFAKQKLGSSDKGTTGLKFDKLQNKDYPKFHKVSRRIYHLKHSLKRYPQIFALDVMYINPKVDFVEYQTEGLKKMVEYIANLLKTENNKPLNNRHNYLIAAPVIGTGGSGGFHDTGIVLDSLLKMLQSFVNTQDNIDILLCCYDRPTFTIAQKKRFENKRYYFPNFETEKPFKMPNQFPTTFELAENLAKKISMNEIVLFLGILQNVICII